MRHRIRYLSNLLFVSQSQTTNKHFSVNSTEKQYIITVISDSMTYGLGVRESETFARLLEMKLKTLKPTKVIVLTLPGDDVIDNYTKLFLAEENIKPNLFIVTAVSNDLALNEVARFPQKITIPDELKNIARNLVLFHTGRVKLLGSSKWRQFIIPHFL